MVGATLLVMVNESYGDSLAECGNGNASDSTGSNNWILGPSTLESDSNTGQICLWYVVNPIVTSSQTFTCSGSYYSICFAFGWSGVSISSPFDGSNVNNSLTTSSSAPWTTNSVSTSGTDLCIAGGDGYYGGTETSWSITGTGWNTLDYYISSGGNYIGGVVGYVISGGSVSGNINPIGESYASAQSAAIIACFLPTISSGVTHILTSLGAGR
jgi:hypothetical protein